MDDTTGTTPEAPQPPVEPPAPPVAPAPSAPPAYPAPGAPQAFGQAPEPGSRPGPASDNSKLLAALGYIIWPVALIALLLEEYKNEKFVKFHAVQALAINLVGWIIASVSSMIPFLGILGVAVLVVAIMGLIKAFQAEYWQVPVVYDVVKGYIGE